MRRMRLWPCVLAGVLGLTWTGADAAVGRTAGEAGVSVSGEAQYSIPLSLPAGARDLTPSLALVYSSGIGQSSAGVGWTVAGLSVIQRCASTVAQDGVARDVRNDLQDRFCLDGQKLRLVSGTYGVAGSEYRTEIESFRRIKAVGAAGNGPAYFVVEGADGLTYEYGNSADSRIESLGQSTAWAWAANRVRDRQGNDIVIVYAEDAANGGYRPDRIDYTGNPSLGVTAPYTVDFVYEPKPTAEIDSGYLAGSRIKYVTRLDRIDVLYLTTTLVRRYDLTYETALSGSGRSRLASVQECAGSPVDCLAATSFTYQNGSIGLGAESSSGATVPTTYVWPLDVNGDGREDLVYPSSATSGSGTWRVLFASTSGGYGAPVNTGVANTNYTGAIPIDYDQDGKGDLLVPYSGGTWWVMLGSSSGLAAPVNTAAPTTTTGMGSNARALDVDGDGRQDLVWADLVGYAGGDAIRYRLRLAGSGFSSTVQVLAGPLPPDQKITSGVFGSWDQRMPTRTPDFNGDGVPDLIFRMTVRDFIDPGTNGPQQGDPPTMDSWEFLYYFVTIRIGGGTSETISADAASEPYFGDFNGDGLTDLLYYDKYGRWDYQYSTGTSFTAPIAGPTVAAYPSGWVINDWDGDGYDDALGPHSSSGTWHLMRSNGEAFAAPVTTGLALGSGTATYTITDLNGDGLKDLAYRDNASTWRYRLHSLDTSLPDLLVSAQDGFGTTASFTYLPITNGAVYTKGTGATFPTVDVQLGRWVVSQLIASDGSGGSSTYAQTFTYEAARRDLQGRGFLGFAKRTSVDARLGYNLKTIESYRQDFPYIGALASLERKQSSGTRISLTSHTWSNLTYGTDFAARRYPYVSASSTDEHEVGGINNGTKIRTIATTVAATGGIDSTSGLIKDVTTVTTEVATGIFASSYRTERLQHTAVLNDTTNWCLGRPTASQVTRSHTLNSGAAVTRTSDATWDAVTCRPTQVRVQPGHASLQVTIGIGYDAFGNLSSETLTGIGMTARTTTTSWGTTGRFPVSTTNPLSQTSTRGWNLALGLPASVTDPNGLATSWSYDAFGRRTLETRPDSSSTAWTYTTCPSGCDSRVKYLVQQEERNASGATVRTDVRYLNRWDAVSYEKRQQLTSSDTVWTARREFDARGRVTRDYMPYFTTGGDSGYRQLSYDALDRVTADALYAAGGALDRTTGFTYSGFSMTRTDPLGHATSQVTNAWGDRVRVTDAASGQVNYEYDAFGLLKKAIDPANNVVTQASYNVRGMPTQLVDVDRGTWSFVPNALGELSSQTDAKSQTTSFLYDQLGRLTSRTEAEGTSTWTWGSSSAAKNIGRLQSLSGPGYSESLTYDALGRLSRRSITSDATYLFDWTYNTLGLPDTLTYPTSTAGVRFKVKYAYAGGYLASIQEYTGNVSGSLLWNLNLLDARFNAVSESYANGLWLQQGFDPLTGLALTRKAGTGGLDDNVQDLAYAWDDGNNLTSRQDLRQGLTESFTYDALDRLTATSGPGSSALAIAYNALGNLTSRSDVGSYSYHATKKHAVIAAGSSSYAYDANGNMSTRNGVTQSWTSYNLPASLSAGGYSAQFAYAPDRSRWRQVSTYAGGTETTIYVGGMVEKLTTAVRTHWKHRIATPSGEVQVIRRSDGTTETLYLTTDHLGSTDTVVNASGTVLARMSFAAWGARRGSGWTGTPSSAEWQAIADTTRRGYTGHEALDNVLLVHMNGRVYDPALGRFMSADPYVPHPEAGQSWNRYSYVHNSPLRHVDPSGYMEDIVVQASRISIPRWPWLGSPATGADVQVGPDGMERVLVLGERLRDPKRPNNNGSGTMPLPLITPNLEQGGSGVETRVLEASRCATICSHIAGASLAAGTAFAGAAAMWEAGPYAMAVAGVLAGGAGYIVGYAGASTPISTMMNGGAVAAASDLRTANSSFLGGAVGAFAESAARSVGATDAIAMPVGGAVGGAAAGAVSGFAGYTGGWARSFQAALSGARSAGAIGFASGAITAATSEALQLATGCDCGR